MSSQQKNTQSVFTNTTFDWRRANNIFKIDLRKYSL